MPTAANAGYYARIVSERAVLRRLVEAGTRIVQFGYAGDGDADELVDRAQAEVYAITDRRIAEDYHPLSEIMPAALEEIEAIGAHGGGISGVPTGFSDLDALTNGLHAGQMVVIAARPASASRLWHSTSRGPRRFVTVCPLWSSRWRWGGTRSRCGSCRPRRGCRCTSCAPGR